MQRAQCLAVAAAKKEPAPLRRGPVVFGFQASSRLDGVFQSVGQIGLLP